MQDSSWLDLPELPEADFLDFLGELATDPLFPDAVAPLEVVGGPTAGAAAPIAAQALQLQFQQQQPCSWQVTTGLCATAERQHSRGSSCSSEASALPPTGTPTHHSSPGSPTPSSSPSTAAPASTSSGAATTAPSSSLARQAAAPSRTRARTQRQAQRQPAAPAATTATTTTSSGDGDDDEGDQDGANKPLTKAQLAAAKRRAPEVDWRAIEDPEERRKQRRLAKNRVTAARSRERKKEQAATMEQRLAAMEADNGRMRALLTSLAAENTTLKEQLASLTRGAAAALNTHGSSPEPAVLECLVTMHLVCCFLACVRASLRVVLPLLPALAQQVARAAGPSPVCSRRCCLTVNACCSSSWSSSSEQRCCGRALDADAAAAQWWRARLRPAVVCA